jgi:lipopolysaccharide export LptBFGC system permease protein LptF
LRRLLPAIGLASVALASVVLLLVLFRFGPALASSRVSVPSVLPLTLWALVPAFGLSLGPAALAGGVLVLGRMRADGELGALRSLGAGAGRLSPVPLLFVAVVAIGGATSSLLLEPMAARAIRAGLGRALASGLARSIERVPAGRFAAPAPGLEVFVSRHGPSGAEDLAIDAGGTVVAARRGRARRAGGAVVLDLEDARAYEGPGRRLAAGTLSLTLPVGDAPRLADLAVPVLLARPTSALWRARGSEPLRALARRFALPALGAAFALWMLPLGLRPLRRFRSLSVAALVVAVGHVAFRLSESASFAGALAIAPAIVTLGAIAALSLLRARE